MISKIIRTFQILVEIHFLEHLKLILLFDGFKTIILVYISDAIHKNFCIK